MQNKLVTGLAVLSAISFAMSLTIAVAAFTGWVGLECAGAFMYSALAAIALGVIGTIAGIMNAGVVARRRSVIELSLTIGSSLGAAALSIGFLVRM